MVRWILGRLRLGVALVVLCFGVFAIGRGLGASATQAEMVALGVALTGIAAIIALRL